MGVNKTSMHGVVAMRVGVAAPLVGEGERAVARLAIRLRNRQGKVDAIVARRESLGWGRKTGKGLKVRIYWAKYFHGMLCEALHTCTAAPLAPSWCSVLLIFRCTQQKMHKGKHEKKGAGNTLKVQHIQR